MMFNRRQTGDVILTTFDVKKTTDCGTLDALLDVAVDLTRQISTAQRYQSVLEGLRRVVPCDAAALLRYVDGALVPLAIDGLSPDTMGRRFVPGDHPRLDAIIASRRPVRFDSEDPRPDPYDGLIDLSAAPDPRVHSCMGCALYLEDQLVGALTADALEAGRFDSVDDGEFAVFAALAAAAMQTSTLIDSLEDLADRRGKVTQHLVLEALQREGGELLGTSNAMQLLREEIEVVAGSDLTVLVTGETGTGKELVARTLHARSSRREQPLVYVNCAALPETIAESELFGHRKGAFTGAVSDRPGKFELAHEGTLFLDEIGELPLSVQAKLLRALQSGEIQRVGADATFQVDVRIIAATNRDLSEAVKEGRFRADLYHRLSVYPIHVPGLSERLDDVPLLAGLFLDRARARLGLRQVRFTRRALGALQCSSWPGNVRELEHVVTRATLRASSLSRTDHVAVDVTHLDLETRPPEAARDETRPAPAEVSELSLPEEMDRYKRDLISRTHQRSGNNWAETARRLKVDRGNLYRTAKKLGLV